MTKIIDTNHLTTNQIVHLKADSIESVIRYISPINPQGEKTVKAAEAKALADAGLRLGLVCEGWGDFAHGGISAGAGERDGEFCAKYARTVGAPDGACVYFAVDTDAGPADVRKLVLPYFSAIRSAFDGSKLRVGVYGSGYVCASVKAASLADLTWLSCSLGWAGSRTYLASNQWALRQHVPQVIANMDTDPDDSNGEWGDFVAFGASAPAVAIQAQPAPPA